MAQRATKPMAPDQYQIDAPRQARLLARFPEIARMGHAVYTAEGLSLFLSTPAPRFNGQTPLQLLEAGNAERVISALGADYEDLS